MINIIPVIDLKSSIAVSGKSGNRAKYKPLKSIYSDNSDPIEIAYKLKQNGVKNVYIADLDAIEKQGNNLELVKKVNMIIPVILDYGVNNLESFEFGLQFATKIIIATETLNDLNELKSIYNKYPQERVMNSVDIKDNKILSKNNINSDELKLELKKLNIKEMIILDIDNIGTSNKFNMDLIKDFKDTADNLIIGGGITNEQLQTIDETSVSGVLVGKAIHNNEIEL